MARLQRDAEHNVHAGIVGVAQVIHAVNFDDINILRVKPVAGPRAIKSEPVATVLEPAISVIGFGDMKPVFLPEIGPVTVVGNAAPAVATGVLRRLCVLLLSVSLFRLVIAVLLLSVFLFLPGVLVLLLRALLFLLVILILLLRALPFLRVVPVLLRAFFLWLRGFLRLRLFLFFLGRLIFVFLLVVLLLLCVDRNTDSEGQRENCRADGTDEFHGMLSPLSRIAIYSCFTASFLWWR